MLIIDQEERMTRETIIRDRLTSLREMRGYKQSEVAEGTGIDQSLVSRHESGDRIPGRKMLDRYATFYGVSVDYITGRTDSPTTASEGSTIPVTRRVPILGTAPCGQPMLAEQNIEGYIDLPGEIAPGSELAAIRIVGDSMQGARLYDGDLALIRIQESVEDGEIAVVCVGDNHEEATVKRVRFADGYVSLYPVPAENRIEEFQAFSRPATQVRIVGKVSGIWWG